MQAPEFGLSEAQRHDGLAAVARGATSWSMRVMRLSHAWTAGRGGQTNLRALSRALGKDTGLPRRAAPAQ